MEGAELLGKRRIAPAVSPNRTWSGFVGGVVTATPIGAGLWWATPIAPWQAALMAPVAALLGFAGDRTRPAKDFAASIAGNGALARIDARCFAAPIFFHLTRYVFAG